MALSDCEGSGKTLRQKRVLKETTVALEDWAQVNRNADKVKRHPLIDSFFEVYTNSLLSGPITHMVNLTANPIALTLAPTKTLLSSLSAAARFDFKTAHREAYAGVQMFTGMAQGVAEVFQIIRKRGKHLEDMVPEELLYRHEQAKQKFDPSITSEKLNASGMLGQFIDASGKMIRLPGNWMLKEDLIGKIINYRVHVNGEAARRAVEAGGGSDNIKKLYNKLRNNPDETIVKQAVDLSDYYTFTNALGKGGTHAAKAIQSVPTLRWLIPFFRTPANIVKFGARHSFAGNIVHDLKDVTKLNSAGDVARARVAIGTVTPLALMTMLDDNMTGAVDMATPLGRHQANLGMRPYSIRIPGTDTWYSYEKVEPVRSILGMMVNAKNAIQNIELVDPDTGEENPEWQQAISTITQPFIQTMGENWMMPTMGNMFFALQGVISGNPDYATKNVVKMFRAMTMPAFVSQVNRQLIDGQFRLAEGYIDQMKANTPGFSKDLPPRLTLWGDPVVAPDGIFGVDLLSPIRTATHKLDAIDEELIRLEVPLPRQPKRLSVGGLAPLELSPAQQHQYQMLRAKGMGGAPSLKAAITALIQNPAYAGMPAMHKSTRIEFLIRQYSESAKQYLIHTDPDLQLQMQMREDARYQQMQTNF